MTLAHPIEKALAEFELIGAVGSEAKKKACAMTLLAWVCGEEWSDHPPCASRLIANSVIRANDHPSTTPQMRRELVRAGEKGVLDTWWVPDEVVAFSLALREVESSDVYERTLRLLARVVEWKVSKQRPVLSGAVLSGADLRGADLRGAVLSGAVLRGAVLRGAVLSGADLRGADLRGAVGTPWGGLPNGWELSDDGLWVRSQK